MRKIDLIVVHCTATVEGKDYDVEEIRKWHLRKGWSDIGYHFLVKLDGTIECGRPVEKIGAHVKGHNANSIGVVYVGGVDENIKPKDTRTEEQKNSLELLLRTLKRFYPEAEIRGHRDFANKACPSFDATSEYSWI